MTVVGENVVLQTLWCAEQPKPVDCTHLEGGSDVPKPSRAQTLKSQASALINGFVHIKLMGTCDPEPRWEEPGRGVHGDILGMNVWLNA